MNIPTARSGKRSSLLDRIRDTCDERTRAEDLSKGFLQSRVYRPLSFYIAAAIAWAGISANQVTVFRLVMVAIAAALFMIGGFTNVLIASFLYVLNVILDFVDGNIARLRGPIGFGRFFEAVADPLVRILIPVAIGIGLYLRPDTLVSYFGTAIDPAWMLIAGFGTGLASSVKYFLAAEFARSSPQEEAKDAGQADPLRGKGRIGILHQTINNALQLLIVAFAIADAISAYLVILFVARGMTTPAALLSLYRRSDRPGRAL
jgi:phosphatidylglycerophosphate synthase